MCDVAAALVGAMDDENLNVRVWTKYCNDLFLGLRCVSGTSYVVAGEHNGCISLPRCAAIKGSRQ